MRSYQITKKINDENYNLVSNEFGVDKTIAENIKEYYKFIGCKVRILKMNNEDYCVYACKTYETPFFLHSYQLGHARASKRDELINKFATFGITNNEKADELLSMNPNSFFNKITNFVKEYYNKNNKIRKESNQIYTSQAYKDDIPVILFLNASELKILKTLKLPYTINNPNPDYIGVISINIKAGNARKLLSKI